MVQDGSPRMKSMWNQQRQCWKYGSTSYCVLPNDIEADLDQGAPKYKLLAARKIEACVAAGKNEVAWEDR